MNHIDNKGSVLIISLVIMSMAMFLTFFIIKITKSITESSKMILDKLEAKILAESEVEKLKFLFSTGSFQNYYFEPRTLLNDYPSKIYLNGTKFILGDDNDIEISILDTSAKINLYLFSEENELRKIFGVLVNSEKANLLTASFLDWIDTDSFTRLGGAETPYYKNKLKAHYGTRNNRFLQDIEELRDIKGFNEEIYRKIKKYSTYIYTAGYINIYLVDSKLLSVYGYIDKALINMIDNLKKTGRLDKLSRLISSKPELSEFLSVEPSKVLEIHVTAKSGKAIEKIYCIIDFKETRNLPYVIYKYKQ